MYGHSPAPSQRLVWLIDEEPAVATETDRELWRRYVEMQSELDRLLEGLGTLENWLSAKLHEIGYDREDATQVFGWEMTNALSCLRVLVERIRELPEKHLVSD
jgi:hypothetical protein